MLHASTQKLIDRLAEMTAQGKIDWIEKDGADAVYATEGYSVALTGEPPRIVLATEGGKILEDTGAADLNSAPAPEGGSYGDIVARMASEASRVARGTETAINALLAGLAGDAPDADAEDTVEASEETPEEETEPERVDAAEDNAPDEDAPADTEQLIDESVPETALLDAEEESLSEETEDEEDDRDADPADDDDFDFHDEDDVSGAVARLADQVNAPAEIEPDALQDAAPTPSFAVTPEGAPHEQDVDDGDVIADASSGPIETEIESPEDTAIKSDRQYVPFGAESAQVAGADVSDTPEEADLDSELGAAASTIKLPQEDSETLFDEDADDELFSEDETEWQVANGAPTLAEATPPQPGDRPLSAPLSLKGLGSAQSSNGSGYRFETDDGFFEEVIVHRSVVIDAMEDDLKETPEDNGAAEEDTSDFSMPEVADADDEIAVSPEDLDAVSPPDNVEAAPKSEASEPAKSSGDKAADTDPDAESPASSPRRKTRFNPWS
ncbi:hypothetical protein [Henriciella litoralis]|uniref:hypothetical protein n=1 Tax=Henriciella litoralis TaxID=568102 RepID=UPI0009FDCE16|nr:hypothetical protein [Henriciella litoralis]